MRKVFAHDAVLTMAADADSRAPGGAITVALCGQWDHDPPCPLAPHHTSAERVDAEVHLRILFATEPDLEDEVRRLIHSGLASGQLREPAEVLTQWQLQRSEPSAVADEEADHAERLRQS